MVMGQQVSVGPYPLGDRHLYYCTAFLLHFDNIKYYNVTRGGGWVGWGGMLK